MAEEGQSLEVTFHNEYLLKMLGAERSADLNEFVKKSVFSHADLKSQMSLLAAALGRISDVVLGQAF